jgi:hypothetical protein
MAYAFLCPFACIHAGASREGQADPPLTPPKNGLAFFGFPAYPIPVDSHRNILADPLSVRGASGELDIQIDLAKAPEDINL